MYINIDGGVTCSRMIDGVQFVNIHVHSRFNARKSISISLPRLLVDFEFFFPFAVVNKFTDVLSKPFSVNNVYLILDPNDLSLEHCQGMTVNR